MASKVLIIQTAFLGDVLLSAPLIRAARNQFQDSEIWYLSRNGMGYLLTKVMGIDRTIEVNKKDKASWARAKAELTKQTFKIVLCPHRSFTSARLVRSLNAEIKIGFKSLWSSLVFDKSLPYDRSLPDALRQLSLMSAVDGEWASKIKSLKSSGTDWKKMSGTKIPDWAQMTTLGADVNSKNILISPGSVWNTKRWTREGFIELGNKLSDLGYNIKIIGSAEEKSICDDIASNIKNAESLAGRTSLLELYKHMRLARLVIANDNGSMHMATLAGVPVVGVFGPTVLDLGYRPWSDQAVVVENLSITCRPCGKHGHDKCPIGTHVCMTSISSTTVFESAKGLVNART